jgi:glycosyltransferase involved in cell wall biosynthesis
VRALALLPCRFWGGPEKQTLRLALWLRRHREVETVLAVMPHDPIDAERNPLYARARAAGLEAALFLQKRRYDVLEGVRLLQRLVDRHQPDVVLATGYKADVLAACLRDVPTVATVRGWTGEDAKVRFFDWLDRRMLPRHDAVTVVSSAQRDAVIRLGVEPARVFRVPNAIELTDLPPPRAKEDLCRELGVDPRRPLIGAVGRLSPEKGHRVLLDAFAGLRRDLPTAHLVLVGDGPEEPALRRQAHGAGLTEHVSFLGLRQDGQQLIAAFDVMALPSFTEGMPNVLLEAFAYGTAAVSTAVGGVTDMVADGRSGWLVSPGRPTELTAALHDALANPAERARRAAEARIVLRESFTVEMQAEAWLHAARSALAAQPARRRASASS